jgi:hypothetical protein
MVGTCHAGEGRHPGAKPARPALTGELREAWIPASAGMTDVWIILERHE